MKTLTTPSTDRISYSEMAPDVYRTVIDMDRAAGRAGLDTRIQDLVKMRASQLNRCVFCLDLHGREARENGETQTRLDQLPAWRESGLFSARERAALALTEAVTLLAEGGVPDAVYHPAAEEFTDKELAALLGAIVIINAWNRIAVTTRMRPDATDG